MNIPDGVYTVFVTPFNSDLSINYENIDKWLKIQLSSDVIGLVLMGTTSESPTINRSEQLDIIKYIFEKNKTHDKPKFIIAGVGGNDTRETLEFSKLCIDSCDAFMVTVPSYNKPTQKGIVEHYKMICNDDLIKTKPIIMYNVPSRTGVNMLPETMLNITECCSNVVAVKEASGSIDQLINIRSMIPKLKVFSGDDNLLLDFMIHGGSGVISVASNVIPQCVYYLTKYCLDGKYICARETFYKIKYNEFIKALFIESNPIPIKYILHTLNIYDNCIMRLPLTKLDEKFNEIVYNAFIYTVNEMSFIVN
jgi:4-hydroxy-tetrahydrodipicolinate synthase